MDEGPISGSLVVTLGDQLRARWHQSTKYVLAAVAVAVAVMSLRSVFEDRFAGVGMTPALEIWLMAFTVVVMLIVMLALFWGVIVVVTALLFLRTGKAQRAVSYAFDAAGFTARDQRAIALTVPWSAIRRARETRRGIVLRMTPNGSRYVPLRAFAPADVPRLRTLIAQHTRFKPR